MPEVVFRRNGGGSWRSCCLVGSFPSTTNRVPTNPDKEMTQFGTEACQAFVGELHRVVMAREARSEREATK